MTMNFETALQIDWPSIGSEVSVAGAITARLADMTPDELAEFIDDAARGGPATDCLDMLLANAAVLGELSGWFERTAQKVQLEVSRWRATQSAA